MMVNTHEHVLRYEPQANPIIRVSKRQGIIFKNIDKKLAYVFVPNLVNFKQR